AMSSAATARTGAASTTSSATGGVASPAAPRCPAPRQALRPPQPQGPAAAKRGANLEVGPGAPAPDGRLAAGEVGSGAGCAGGDLERHRLVPDAGPPRHARRVVPVQVPAKAPPPEWDGEAIVGRLPVPPPAQGRVAGGGFPARFPGETQGRRDRKDLDRGGPARRDHRAPAGGNGAGPL